MSKLIEKREKKLQKSLNENANLNTFYMMKEQLQSLWESDNIDKMKEALEVWCELANESGLL